MRKVLLIRPHIDPRAGGGTAVAVWTMEALRDAYDLSVLTLGAVDIAALNRYYGTALQSVGVNVLEVPRPLRCGLAPARLQLLRLSYMMRHCRRLASQYDIMIGIDNEMDFGRRGIQYIDYPRFHDPRFDARVLRAVEPFSLRWYHAPPLMRIYGRLALAVAGFSAQRMRANLTLVNSDWTGQLVRATHGIDSVTVYPPVRDDFAAVPWEEREDGFICLGRIAPEKHIETIVDILQRVRDCQRGADRTLHLHIAGAAGPADYMTRVRRLQAAHADWVRLEIDPPRSALVRLLSGHRYAIHAMRREPFGIAVAEAVRAGCLLFVPSDGGLVEIVGRYPNLVYDTPTEATAKILAMLRDAARQRAALQHLATRAPQCSTQRFMEQMRVLVASFSE